MKHWISPKKIQSKDRAANSFSDAGTLECVPADCYLPTSVLESQESASPAAIKVFILGCRGIPASHGGFETFAERLALFLVERGHQVTVYCQSDTPVEGIQEDFWRGIRRITLHGGPGPGGTIAFDWAAARHARSQPGILLTLGYNTALFSLLYKLSGRRSIMNMDGLEWKRQKWSRMQRLWLRLNERAGVLLSDHLIADHPDIGTHLAQFAPAKKISVIPYSAEAVVDANPSLLDQFGLIPGSYAIVIARPEPENSLLEIVEAFSRKRRGIKLVVLGRYDPGVRQYDRQVFAAASPEVVFAGSIYAAEIVRALRFFARAYLHGHQVGGTNPSLVESLAAGNPVIAHDNRFNRSVAGRGQAYFAGADELNRILDSILDDPAILGEMARRSRERHQESFTPVKVLSEYERLLLKFQAEHRLS